MAGTFPRKVPATFSRSCGPRLDDRDAEQGHIQGNSRSKTQVHSRSLLTQYVKGGWHLSRKGASHLLRFSFGQSVLIHLTRVVVGTARGVDLTVANLRRFLTPALVDGADAPSQALARRADGLAAYQCKHRIGVC